MRVVVVGAGVAGLTAARDLRAAGHDVAVLESSPQVGGKLRRHEVAGVSVDVGAEAMLARRPEGVALAAALGVPVTHPTAASSRIWTRGELRPLPRTLMGVPLDLDQLATTGILSEAGLERVRHQHAQQLDPEADASLGDLVAARYGDEVVDRLVEPLLGGVYAGHARALSLRATVPALVPVLAGADPAPTAALSPTGPVFAGIAGGMGRLTDALAAGGGVVTEATVRALRRTAAGFELTVGPVPDETTHQADAVVLATPAAPTARLLSDLAPGAAAELREIDYASVVVVTLAVPRAALLAQAPGIADSSGFLVPPVEGRRIKASTFSFAKWEWVAAAGGDLALLRTSLGRLGDEVALQATDEELVAWSLADLRDAVGLTATPVDTHVQRWGGGLPQYAVGHLDRVARIRRSVAQVPGLAVCGAAYDGVGVPACIASAHSAVRALAGVGTIES